MGDWEARDVTVSVNTWGQPCSSNWWGHVQNVRPSLGNHSEPMRKAISLEIFQEISNKSSRLSTRNAWVKFRCLLAALAVKIMCSICRVNCASIGHTALTCACTGLVGGALTQGNLYPTVMYEACMFTCYVFCFFYQDIFKKKKLSFATHYLQTFSSMFHWSRY